jgi:hypothetical protein
MAEKPPTINPREISLYSVFSDVDSKNPEIRLRPRPDVTGEELFRQSTIIAVESLLRIRDLAVEFATRAKPDQFDSFVRDFRRALCLPVDDAEKDASGNYRIPAAIPGVETAGGDEVEKFDEMTGPMETR